MEFKHAFHVFIDNFFSTYKILVYRLIVLAITVGLGCAIVIPTINNLSNTVQFANLQTAFSDFWADVIALNADKLHDGLRNVISAVNEFTHLISDKSGLVALACCLLAVVFFLAKFLTGVGNYVAGALVNDRMVMHANSSFTFTLFKNIKKSLLYAIIYAAITFVYDILCLLIIWAIIMVGLKSLPITLIKIFLIAVLLIVFSTVKFAFITDWLPALIQSKMNNRKALRYAFSRKGKKSANVFSNILVIKILIIAINVAAGIFTLGAGLLVSVPASYLLLSCFSFVNYFDANKFKYFVDEYTVVGPKKETPVTKEEFFRGEEQ